MANKFTNTSRTVSAQCVELVDPKNTYKHIDLTLFFVSVTFRLLGSVRDHQICRIFVRNTSFSRSNSFFILAWAWDPIFSCIQGKQEANNYVKITLKYLFEEPWVAVALMIN